MFIGFTGTPLLKADKATSIETFGSFIHTYKFDEAVDDGVVLDLRYEARNIDQDLTSPAKVDKWFEAKTKGMTDLSKAELKKRWGTMQKVVSSEPRAEQIVNDILLDMETKPRLMDGRGNAMLVGVEHLPGLQVLRAVLPGRLQGQVRHRHQLRAATPATSPRRTPARARPRSCASTTSTARCWPTTSTSPPTRRCSKVEQFEKEVKDTLHQRARPDAPADRRRQAADRLRRPERHLPLHRQEDAATTACSRPSAASTGSTATTRTTATSSTTGTCSTRWRRPSPTTPAERSTATRRRTSRACSTDRIEQGPRRPRRGAGDRSARSASRSSRPRTRCSTSSTSAPTSRATPSSSRPTSRSASSSTRRSPRSCAPTATSPTRWTAAGYSDAEADAIKDEIAHYVAVRDEVEARRWRERRLQAVRGRHALPARHLHPGRSRPRSSPTSRTPASIELIVKLGAGAIDKLPDGIKKDPEAVAETIANNMRKVIIDERAMNPKYYDKMSELLDALIEQRRQGAIDYKEYLPSCSSRPRKLGKGESDTDVPGLGRQRRPARPRRLRLPERRARHRGRHGRHGTPSRTHWVGNPMKEKKVKRAHPQVAARRTSTGSTSCLTW